MNLKNYLNDITTKAKLEKISKLGIDILKDYKSFISGVKREKIIKQPCEVKSRKSKGYYYEKLNIKIKVY